MSAAMIYITCEDETQAREIGRTLVAERLAACVNVLPGMTSLYRWEGEVRESAEAVLVAKTRLALAEALAARVLEQHSYDVPCVVVLPILGGNPDFLRFIEEQTRTAS
jgi:periplasmic divalent cation tolerance protein